MKQFKMTAQSVIQTKSSSSTKSTLSSKKSSSSEHTDFKSALLNNIGHSMSEINTQQAVQSNMDVPMEALDNINNLIITQPTGSTSILPIQSITLKDLNLLLTHPQTQVFIEQNGQLVNVTKEVKQLAKDYSANVEKEATNYNSKENKTVAANNNTIPTKSNSPLETEDLYKSNTMSSVTTATVPNETKPSIKKDTLNDNVQVKDFTPYGMSSTNKTTSGSKELYLDNNSFPQDKILPKKEEQVREYDKGTREEHTRKKEDSVTQNIQSIKNQELQRFVIQGNEQPNKHYSTKQEVVDKAENEENQNDDNELTQGNHLSAKHKQLNLAEDISKPKKSVLDNNKDLETQPSQKSTSSKDTLISIANESNKDKSSNNIKENSENNTLNNKDHLKYQAENRISDEEIIPQTKSQTQRNDDSNTQQIENAIKYKNTTTVNKPLDAKTENVLSNFKEIVKATKSKVEFSIPEQITPNERRSDNFVSTADYLQKYPKATDIETTDNGTSSVKQVIIVPSKILKNDTSEAINMKINSPVIVEKKIDKPVVWQDREAQMQSKAVATSATSKKEGKSEEVTKPLLVKSDISKDVQSTGTESIPVTSTNSGISNKVSNQTDSYSASLTKTTNKEILLNSKTTKENVEIATNSAHKETISVTKARVANRNTSLDGKLQKPIVQENEMPKKTISSYDSSNQSKRMQQNSPSEVTPSNHFGLKGSVEQLRREDYNNKEVNKVKVSKSFIEPLTNNQNRNSAEKSESVVTNKNIERDDRVKQPEIALTTKKDTTTSVPVITNHEIKENKTSNLVGSKEPESIAKVEYYYS